MIYGTCTNCGTELEVDENDSELSKTHLVPIILPIFRNCTCGKKYAITTDCDYDDSVLILDFDIDKN